MGPDPAVAAVRRAVRLALTHVDGPVLVACSGGADSLALAAAIAFEAPRQGSPPDWSPSTTACRPGRPIRRGGWRRSATSSASTRSRWCRSTVGTTGGPEAAARAARYAALDRGRRRARRAGAARPHPRRPGRDGAARARPRVRAALDRRDARRRRALPASAARPAAGDDRGGLRGARLPALGRPAQRRPELPAGAAAPRGAAAARGRPAGRRRRGAGPHRGAASATTSTRSDRALAGPRRPCSTRRARRADPCDVDVTALAAQPAAVRTRVLRPLGVRRRCRSADRRPTSPRWTRWSPTGTARAASICRAVFVVTRASGRLSLLPHDPQE